MAPTVRRAAGRAACWQVADEHTGPGTGRTGTDGASGQGEMLAGLVKNVVGLKETESQCFQQQPFHHSGARPRAREIKIQT